MGCILLQKNVAESCYVIVPLCRYPRCLPRAAVNDIGEEARKAAREAATKHNRHLPPGMKELEITI